MTTEQMIEEVVLELKKIMGDKYYEGAGTDFTAENIIELFRKYLSTIATKSAEEEQNKIGNLINSTKNDTEKLDLVVKYLNKDTNE